MHELNTPWPEAKFRIKTPNAKPRKIRVVCLNEADIDVKICRSNGDYSHVEFCGPDDFRTRTGIDPAQALAGNLDVETQKRVDLWIGRPDLVIICGCEDNDPTLGILAAQAYRAQEKPVNITGFVRVSTGSNVSDKLRPLCSMMSLVTSVGYLADLLGALGTRG